MQRTQRRPLKCDLAVGANLLKVFSFAFPFRARKGSARESLQYPMYKNACVCLNFRIAGKHEFCSIILVKVTF